MKFSEEFKAKLESQCIFSASRSSGPGGQNVNKVNTRVELRFCIGTSYLFSDEEKEIIRLKLKNRINSEDEIVLFSEVKRSQLGNKENVLNKFFALIEKTLTPQKKRIKTNPTTGSVEKRLENKKSASIKKQMRRPPEV